MELIKYSRHTNVNNIKDADHSILYNAQFLGCRLPALLIGCHGYTTYNAGERKYPKNPSPFLMALVLGDSFPRLCINYSMSAFYQYELLLSADTVEKLRFS